VIARAAQAESVREIGTEMGIEQHGGSGIDEIERLHYLLPFAIGISRDAPNVFEIDWALRSWVQGAPVVDGQDFHAEQSDRWRMTNAVNGRGPEGTGNWKNWSRGSRCR
jgi:hypothetical protein